MNDDKVDRYLFDPAASPADEVKEIEQILASLRYDADTRPLKGLRRRRVATGWLAAAAMLVLLIGAAAWLWTWPAEQPWAVVSGSMATLPVGRTVRADESLRVRIARIGWMEVAKGSVLTLRSTRSNRHRLAMNSGTIHVSVWAPPTSVAFATPAGDVIDLGCEFILDVDPHMSRVDVVSGWVQLANAHGEVLVPGGATSHMPFSGRPAAPLFKTAHPSFRAAVRALERGAPDAVEPIVRTARSRDVLTLLVLAERGIERDRLLVRAAELMPPKSPRTLARARRGDSAAIWQWAEELPLPPAKGWIRNWRDRLGLR